MIQKVNKSCSVRLKSGSLINFLILSTMTLLVFASIVIISIISVTPIVMLAIGELEAGQRDIILQPRLDYLNATKVSQVGEVSAMPRHKAFLSVNSGLTAFGWFMDFRLQKNNHLGTIGGDQPDHHNFIYAHESLGLKERQTVSLSFIDHNLIKSIKKAVEHDQFQTDNKEEIIQQIEHLYNNLGHIEGKFVVREIFNTARGKFGIGQVNNYLYLDIQWALQQMINQTYAQKGLDPANSALIALLNSPRFQLAQFSTEATINLPNRVEVYSNPNYDETYDALSGAGHQLLKRVGLFSVETRMPIAGSLVNLGFVGMFIGVMLKLIICSLFILSALMMNNMFRMGVQRRNFDFALLKVMGADRFFVVANILASAFKYVALANLFAFPLAYAALQVVTLVFEDFFGYRHEIVPTADSVLGGLLIGVLVPIISAISPIWSVLRNDLAENLNPLRNKTEATKVQVYVEGREFPAGKVLFGVLAAGYGLMIYYLLPRALINQNLGLLLIIFFAILEGLLVGLILLSFSVQYVFERIVAYCCLFWVEATDLLLTLKNLSSHRFRNRRTALLYALSVSFIVFVSVGLQIQLQTMYIQLLKLNGCFIVVTGNIDRRFYNNMLKNIEEVQDWAYVSQYLRQVLEKKKGFKDVLISDTARIQFVDNRIYAVSPNLINTFFYDKVSVVRTESEPPYDPYSYLYSPNGLMTSTISKDTAQQFGILDGDNHQFYVNLYYDYGFQRIPLKYTSIFTKRMGLLYSYIVLKPQIGVSFDTFRKIASIPEDEEVPIGEVKVKVKHTDDVKAVADKIRRLNRGFDEVWDYTELKGTLDKIDGILSSVTYILLGIVLTISFFSLLTTAYLNVVGQTNEIAILLILGYSRSRITRLYIYQNLVLVLNSCLIGLVVGYLVAQIMGLQRQIFSELPISVEVRGVPLLLVMALVSSCLSTYKPLKEIFSLTVGQILNYSK